MDVLVDIAFKADAPLTPERIHHLYFPAQLTTSDGCLETKNMQIVGLSIENITVDCGGKPSNYLIKNDPSV